MSQRPAVGCLFEIVETLVLTLIIFVVIQNFVAQPYKVQQQSMERTLEPEQYVLVDKLTPRFDAYKRGDYDITLFECRGAMEAMAKHASQGDTKQGFSLIGQRAFGDDELRKDVTDGVIKALAEYSHALGRHQQYPPVRVTQAEAEFALASHIQLVALLTRAISGREARAVL